jgi:large subunit ribosomal protein L21
MYAVFQLSGSQFSVEEGAVIKVPLQDAEKGSKIDITDVLLVKDNDKAMIGSPYVDGAKIEAEVLDSGKSDKVRIYKYKRRTKYRRRQGHRQQYSEIKIDKIVVPQL